MTEAHEIIKDFCIPCVLFPRDCLENGQMIVACLVAHAVIINSRVSLLARNGVLDKFEQNKNEIEKNLRKPSQS